MQWSQRALPETDFRRCVRNWVVPPVLADVWLTQTGRRPEDFNALLMAHLAVQETNRR